MIVLQTDSLLNYNYLNEIYKFHHVRPISLSLSLFEALRGLRDAAAPESAFQVQTTQSDPSSIDKVTSAQPDSCHNTHGTTTRSTVLNRDPDYEDFLLAYHHKEPLALDLISKTGEKVPKSREEYIKFRAKVQKEKDQSLVSKVNLLNN